MSPLVMGERSSSSSNARNSPGSNAAPMAAAPAATIPFCKNLRRFDRLSVLPAFFIAFSLVLDNPVVELLLTMVNRRQQERFPVPIASDSYSRLRSEERRVGKEC